MPSEKDQALKRLYFRLNRALKKEMVPDGYSSDEWSTGYNAGIKDAIDILEISDDEAWYNDKDQTYA